MEEEKGFSRSAMLLVLTAGLASLLEVLDSSIVNVAVPTMMGNLGATVDSIAWVVTGYIISNAVVLPISGWLGMRLGRRVYYIGCIVLFTLTSVACGLAPNLATLIAFRVIQGLAGGALLPTSQALIQEAFPGKKAAMGSALFAMVVVIGPTIGPPLGGYLTDHYGWRMIFDINVPFGILAAFLAYLHVKDLPATGSHAESQKQMMAAPVDLFGLALLVIGVGSLQFVLDRGQDDDWFSSGVILTYSILAAIAIPLFIWWELKIKNPIVDLRLFKNIQLLSGTIMMLAVGWVLYAIVFFIPIFATNVLGMNATQNGNLFMPSALAAIFFMPMVAILMGKFDPRLLMLLGVGFTAVTLVMMGHMAPQTGYWELFWPLMWRSLGTALLFIPVNTVALATFKDAELGQAAGVINLSRQIGGSASTAILNTISNNSSNAAYEHMRQFISPLNAQFMNWTRSAQGTVYSLTSEIGLAHPDMLMVRSIYYKVKAQSFVMGFDQLCWWMLAVFMVSLIPIYFLKMPKGVKAGAVGMH